MIWYCHSVRARYVLVHLDTSWTVEIHSIERTFATAQSMSRTVLLVCVTTHLAGSAGTVSMPEIEPPTRGRKSFSVVPSCHFTCVVGTEQ
jgi:hypothetical protein